MTTKLQLLIPVENQVRELDPKLLLACVAARRGFSAVIGSRREMEFRIASFPPSLYLSKSITIRSALLFKAAHKVGHGIVAWDEEALVHLPPETYFSDRLSPASIRYVSHLLAWGQDNANLWQQYPNLPNGIAIHLTGNQRAAARVAAAQDLVGKAGMAPQRLRFVQLGMGQGCAFAELVASMTHDVETLGPNPMRRSCSADRQ